MANYGNDDELYTSEEEGGLSALDPEFAATTLPRVVGRAELVALLTRFHREHVPFALSGRCLSPHENYSGLDFGDLEAPEFDWTTCPVFFPDTLVERPGQMAWCYTAPTLKNVRLAEGVWNGAIFAGADLSGADLEHASFIAANFVSALLVGAYCSHSVFVQANLGLVRAECARFIGATLVGASLSGADFSHANLAGAILDGATCFGARFEAANLTGASFRKADLRGADFSGATLLGVDFTGAQRDEHVQRWVMEWAGRSATPEPVEPLPAEPPFDYAYDEEEEPTLLGDPYGGGGYTSDEDDEEYHPEDYQDNGDDPFLPDLG